ncbi:hypothetical protein DFH27DRAFT_328405 [Peziza echinospora]|nr:hypothetical protein DFH27DRAFT_328405 [Peziza echinospora]
MLFSTGYVSHPMPQTSTCYSTLVQIHTPRMCANQKIQGSTLQGSDNIRKKKILRPPPLVMDPAAADILPMLHLLLSSLQEEPSKEKDSIQLPPPQFSIACVSNLLSPPRIGKKKRNIQIKSSKNGSRGLGKKEKWRRKKSMTLLYMIHGCSALRTSFHNTISLLSLILAGVFLQLGNHVHFQEASNSWKFTKTILYRKSLMLN